MHAAFQNDVWETVGHHRRQHSRAAAPADTAQDVACIVPNPYRMADITTTAAR